MPKVSHGDVVLLPIAFVSGVGSKVRPALVVQNDDLNARLNSTVVAIITSTTERTQAEPTQLFIHVSTPDGQQTGLLHDSAVKCEHLDTVDQCDIMRVIGRLSPTLIQQLESCLTTSAVVIDRGTTLHQEWNPGKPQIHPERP